MQPQRPYLPGIFRTGPWHGFLGNHIIKASELIQELPLMRGRRNESFGVSNLNGTIDFSSSLASPARVIRLVIHLFAQLSVILVLINLEPFQYFLSNLRNLTVGR
jgi:hypothetical protein